MKTYLIIQFSVVVMAAGPAYGCFTCSISLKGVYWERGDDWDYTAALQGNSFYKLPKVLQWFSEQHRVSSRPSPEPTDSKLQPGTMSQGGAVVQHGAGGHAVFQLQIIYVPPLGRTASQTRRLGHLRAIRRQARQGMRS